MAPSSTEPQRSDRMLTIDCGTTNSRVYLVNSHGEILLWKSRKVGVKDTAIRGSNDYLKEELKALTEEVLKEAGISKSEIRLVISSGMITSELGLIELPHLFAPVSMEDLSGSITRVDGEESFDPDLPLYLIRGIKNPYHPERNDLSELARLDFMRGEETQVAGLLQLYGSGIPSTVINLSSHTKCIPIDQRDRILGSVTTLSGQVFEALVKETFIGKSVIPVGSTSGMLEATSPLAKPEESPPFDPEMADLAYEIVREAGLLRGFVMPRFMDVLLRTSWQQRRKFVESALAVDDLLALRLFPKFGFPYGERIFLVGPRARCEIFEYYLIEKMQIPATIRSISDPMEISLLAVQGALYLAKKRGLF
ncbi:MAG: 2-dehydro-3-deoxygalactonokinase [Spirochaetes bacterium]|nr:2-dehydro-3-deoxygalactonokinase [Spirochaetota bacterium]